MSTTHRFCFDYELPRELVAQEPLRNRVDARLMVVDRRRQTIEHYHVRDLPELLKAGDRLVLNDTKVIPAQLAGKRIPTGGRWQGLYLETTADGHWKLLCKSRGRMKPGDSIDAGRRRGPAGREAVADRAARGRGSGWPIRSRTNRRTYCLRSLGRVPLPPYIRGGQMVDADVTNYQTVFARVPGAIAAPTAGLHFSKELLKTLAQRGVKMSAVTLHVGLGTFRPIASESLDEHRMHREWGELSATAAGELNASRQAGERLIAVGTTVTRVLETAVRAPGASRDEFLALARRDGSLHSPAVRVSGDRRAAHELSFPADDTLGARRDFRRSRTHRARLPRSDSRRVPLLQLRRRDADSVKG